MQVWKPWSPMIAEGCPEKTEIPMVCWPQCKKKWDFPAKMDRSLSTHLPSQSADCVEQASCIQLAHNFFHQWLYESGLLCYSAWFFLLFGPWIQLACLTQSTDWLGKWVNKLLSIFAGKSHSFLRRGQHTIGISIYFGHSFAIIGLRSFYTCIWDLRV